MNFTFEGNYKPKRNINLGGVKSQNDKRSLLLKLQNERRAREDERHKWKCATRIQSFYRGRQEAGLLHGQQMKDFEELLRMNQTNTSLFTLTRELLLFYPTTQNNVLLTEYLALMTRNDFQWTRFMLAMEDEEVLDTWLWQVCLVVKKVLLPALFAVEEAQVWLSFLTMASSYKTHALHTRIATYIILKTPCFELIRTAAPATKDLENILVHLITLSPPFEFPDSRIKQFLTPPPRTFGGLFSGSHSNTIEENMPQSTHFLSRDVLIERIVSGLLVQPFLLEGMNSRVATSMARHFPFKVILDMTRQRVMMEEDGLSDQDVAGLLMNVSVISTLDSGEYLEGVLPSYAETIQVLLSRLPVLSLESDQDRTNMKQSSDSSDDSSSDEDDDKQGEDIKMKEAPPILSEEIKACLATLYSPDKINHLLHQFAHQATLHSNDLNVVGSISSFFNTLMLRWPAKKEQVLNAILYKSKEYHLIPLLYQAWSSTNEAKLFNGEAINSQLQFAVASFSKSPNSWSILYLLNELYTRFLLTLADMEFLDKSEKNTNHLPLSQVIDLSRQLKNIAFVLFWRANTMDLDQTVGSAAIRLHQLRSSATHLLQHIHMRDSRRPFCPNDHWLINDLDTHGFSSEVVAEEFNLESEPERRHPISKSRLAVVSPRLGLLNNIPFVIPFEQRVEIFRMFVENDKKRNRVDLFRHSEASTIRRHHMFEDGFKAFHTMGEGFKNRVAITFVDDFGLEEAGIDGGGVFKEFLTGLSHEAFDESYGLFVTTSEQLLYPNPNLHATKPLESSYFEFLGLMIGKAVYEGILLDVAFAEFFLKKCLGKVNYLDDLASLDPELYKGLLDIKKFTGNVEDLSLDFTVTRHDGRTIELVPGGSNIPVTNQNRLQYIYAIADYKLNKQISKQCRAFFTGLSTIIDIKWLRMFNQQELQILLGGASVPIDLNDLRANTLYARFTESDKTIQNFWRALESFDNEHRMKFVKFVTSCSRPPLLGFKELVPKFCIGNAGATDDRLPTSSTCVNLLKLPDFSSFEILKSKLMYAITADAGFDLS